jgi:hypothetical protein
MNRVKVIAWLTGCSIAAYSAFCTALVSWVGMGSIISIHLVG